MNNKQGYVWTPYIIISTPIPISEGFNFNSKLGVSTRYSSVMNYEAKRREKIMDQRNENIDNLLNG